MIDLHDTIVAAIGRAILDAICMRPRETTMRMRIRYDARAIDHAFDLAFGHGVAMLNPEERGV